MNKKILSYAKIIMGNVITALAINCFILPTGILVGGVSGIGMAVNHFFGIDVSLVVIIINVVTFVFGLWILGGKFAAKTIISTIMLPVFLDLFSRIEFMSHISDDLLLCAIMTGLMAGLGVGLIIGEEASTGGADIPPIIVNKLTGLSISKGMLIMNLSVLVIQLPYSNIEQILYGIINTIIISIVLNYMAVSGASKTQVFVISPKYEKIRDLLIANNIGTTLVNIETGYQKMTEKAVLFVFSQRQLFNIRQKINEVDPDCFIIINSVSEVGGQGFTRVREYK